VHHPHPPGVQDRAEAFHHPGAGAEVPRQAGGGLPSHRQAEVQHRPGQSGQAGKHFFYLLCAFRFIIDNSRDKSVPYLRGICIGRFAGSPLSDVVECGHFFTCAQSNPQNAKLLG
jgi:hypothetical protein